MKIRHPMLLKKLLGIIIPPNPHGINLPLRPLVQIHWPNESQVHAHIAMGRAAIQAEKDTISGGGPRGAGVGTVETYGILAGEAEKEK